VLKVEKYVLTPKMVLTLKLNRLPAKKFEYVEIEVVLGVEN
jgi:hypothetical protein